MSYNTCYCTVDAFFVQRISTPLPYAFAGSVTVVMTAGDSLKLALVMEFRDDAGPGRAAYVSKMSRRRDA